MVAAMEQGISRQNLRANMRTSLDKPASKLRYNAAAIPTKSKKNIQMNSFKNNRTKSNMSINEEMKYKRSSTNALIGH